MVDKDNEYVLCVRKDALQPFQPMPMMNLESLWSLDNNEFSFRRRAECETNEDYLQIIPYTVIGRFDEQTGQLQVLMYDRGQSGGEQRLNDRYSIGFGGHVNLVDAQSKSLAELVGSYSYYMGRPIPSWLHFSSGSVVPLDKDISVNVRATVMAGAKRELAEEVSFSARNWLDLSGYVHCLIYDPSNAVGKVHLGVLSFVLATHDCTRQDLLAGRAQWVDWRDLPRYRNELESWSLIVQLYIVSKFGEGYPTRLNYATNLWRDYLRRFNGSSRTSVQQSLIHHAGNSMMYHLRRYGDNFHTIIDNTVVSVIDGTPELLETTTVIVDPYHTC